MNVVTVRGFFYRKQEKEEKEVLKRRGYMNKRFKFYMMILIFMFLCGMSMEVEAAVQKNSNDVKELNKIIRIQKKRGAKVSEDIDNKKQYHWSKKTGRLVKLRWYKKNVTGKVDISNLKALKTVYLNENNITAIKFGKLKVLEDIQVINNKLKVIDISKLKKLKYFICNKNKIRKLNITVNKKLKILGCRHNKIKKLNLKNLRKLKMLTCSNNQLENLDVSNCRLEWGLFCQDNKIKTLKLKRKSEMAYLWC